MTEFKAQVWPTSHALVSVDGLFILAVRSACYSTLRMVEIADATHGRQLFRFFYKGQ